MRASRISASGCVTRVGSRRSGITAASFSAIPIRRAACASSITPPSDDSRPPSNAAVSFLPRTAGNQNGRSRIVGHGGCGRLERWTRVGFSNQILRHINRLGYVRQTLSQPVR